MPKLVTRVVVLGALSGASASADFCQDSLRNRQLARTEAMTAGRLLVVNLSDRSNTPVPEMLNFLSKAPEKLRRRIAELQKEKMNPDSVYRFSARKDGIDSIVQDIDILIHDIETVLEARTIGTTNLTLLVYRIAYGLSYLSSDELKTYILQIIHNDETKNSNEDLINVAKWSQQERDDYISDNLESFSYQFKKLFVRLDSMAKLNSDPAVFERILRVSAGRFTSPFFTWQITTNETTSKFMARGVVPVTVPDGGLISYDGVLNRLPVQYLEHDLGHLEQFARGLFESVNALRRRDGLGAVNLLSSTELTAAETIEFRRYYNMALKRLQDFIEFGERRFQGDELKHFFNLAVVFIHEGRLRELFMGTGAIFDTNPRERALLVSQVTFSSLKDQIELLNDRRLPEGEEEVMYKVWRTVDREFLTPPRRSRPSRDAN